MRERTGEVGISNIECIITKIEKQIRVCIAYGAKVTVKSARSLQVYRQNEPVKWLDAAAVGAT